jgi:hypothetical protein
VNATAAPAGYSGTPLPKKLGIKAGQHVLFQDAPEGFDPRPLPDDVTVDRRAGAAPDDASGDTFGDRSRRDAASSPDRDPYDVILAFVADRAALTEAYARLPGRLDRAGALWICWPKKSSGVITDVSESVVRDDALALPIGLVDVKVAAIDATWSALKMVFRLTHR